MTLHEVPSTVPPNIPIELSTMGTASSMGTTSSTATTWKKRRARRREKSQSENLVMNNTPSHTLSHNSCTTCPALLALCVLSVGMNVEINVLNGVTLSEVERIILGMGLNWIPVPLLKRKWNFDNAYNEFERNVRLRHYFLSSESTQEKNTPELKLHRFVEKQLSFEEKQIIFTPPKSTSKVLEHYLKTVKHKLNILSSKRINSKQNETSNKAIIDAINALKARKDIVIKNSDKNKGTAVMSYEYYHTEALGINQLGDPKTYKLLNEMEFPSYHTFLSGLKAIFEKQECFTKHIANRLFKDLSTNIKLNSSSTPSVECTSYQN